MSPMLYLCVQYAKPWPYSNVVPRCHQSVHAFTSRYNSAQSCKPAAFRRVKKIYGNLSHVFVDTTKIFVEPIRLCCTNLDKLLLQQSRNQLICSGRPKTGLYHNLLMSHGITSLATLWSLGIHSYIANYIASQEADNH